MTTKVKGSARLAELLERASTAFAEMRDPFSGDWLVENDVTLDECHDLSMAVSVAIDMFMVQFGRVLKR